MDERLIPIRGMFRSNEALLADALEDIAALTFLAQHEAYHIGRMCLIRRIHGMPAAEWPRF